MSIVRMRILLGAALAAAFVPALRADNADDVQPAAKAKVAVLKLGGSFGEDPAPAAPFGPQRTNFKALLERIRQMAADKDLAGVELQVDGLPDFARTLDLLRELRALKEAGKKVCVYSETLDQRQLMVASLADLLVVPPSGAIVLEGLLAEIMYYKDLLALLDARAEVIHIGAFKSAYENFARDTMSDENRTVLTLLLEEFYNQMLDSIAANRGLARSAVEDLYEQLFIDPTVAQSSGLVSHVGYRDQYELERERLFGADVELVTNYGDKSAEDLEKMLENPLAMFSMLPKLLKPQKQKLPDEPRIAIVYATGPIQSGKSQSGLDGTVAAMGSDTIVKALDAAAEDDWVKAVILRINSPGGSALASDMIWRATQRVKEKKPIIASMGGVAGSGGYWIAMGCNRIMAQPSTITGSIGVVGMLPDVSRTLRRVGINVEVVGKGPHSADLALLRNGPTELLKSKVRVMMEAVYQEFIAKVAEGRHMNPQIVESLARGRVWTGRQAADLNLVDALGGLDDAIALACELGGGLDPKTVVVAEYPEAPNFFEALEEAFGEMVTVDGRLRSMLTDAGYGDLVAMAELLVQNAVKPLGKESVQAILPFGLRIK